MKVYCDRLAVVKPNHNDKFDCPKCRGMCRKSETRPNWWDCMSCGRGWEKVPNHIKTAAQAEVYLMGNA